uniref:Uncharacterized protein n=1 Tax=Tanacetum cinerariifolium TaxID=118510 RepID=A0A6L2P5N0_TANCI|nr:hypothetical protein [Tanacetum cinerariifolium]
MPKFTIKSTDKAALNEFDQKGALYQTMHVNKSINRNLANHRLYHALMKALIEDENAMDKGVADTIKDHKRKHNDDKDPPTGLNHGKKTKRRRTKESESFKKPSTTKEPLKGKALSKGSKTGKFVSTKEPVEEPTTEVVMDDVSEDVVHDDDQPQDTSKPKTTNNPNPEWFTQPLRPPTPDPKWNKRDYYPFDMSKPLPLQGHPGHLTVAVDYFFNNDLEYLKSFDLARMYTRSITKTKAAQYEIVGIEDMVPTLWRVKSISVKKLHGYGHLEEIVVKRADRQLYKFKEDDFVDLYINDIEDMLLLVVQHKLFHLTDSDIVDFIMALHMFTLVIKKRVEDLQLGKRVMQADELYKFSNGTLKKIQDELHHRVLDFDLGYNKEMSRRKWTATDKKRSEIMVELIDKKMYETRIIRNLKRLVGARELEMD